MNQPTIWIAGNHQSFSTQLHHAQAIKGVLWRGQLAIRIPSNYETETHVSLMRAMRARVANAVDEEMNRVSFFREKEFNDFSLEEFQDELGAQERSRIEAALKNFLENLTTS